MKDDKKTDDVEIDRLKQWYNYFVVQNTNLFNRNAKLQNVISEVSKKYKKYTANACKVVNERWANKYPQHARSG